MAKKARCFEVTLRDGHGIKTSTLPAQSKLDLLNRLKVPNTVKLIDVKHIGWRDVAAEPNDDLNGVNFKITGANSEITISHGDIGHDYLTQQIPDQVKNVHEYLDDYHNPDR